ncbi:serine/threonine protein kinase [Pseudomonas aeruginosa]|uniref:Serine/threonine protein kinase n=1 Tax=Pseudomonas aeruginosa TaxID=287 RepID=A0A643J5B5_PSEAI|nr:serine/threonine-protein kinase [Pseudomonas aeruginosa]KAB0768500.1 serine/threonine protein kinase [Pseudomonas aeruginosa]MBH8938568.1 serine/threonine protein kinase [Pseudomonas aeruginosa]MCW5394438.1 serine/threonine protein kinase [Pseudomonas aeruginosa]MCW5419145.1 serine/threonine protein kinase [Pseudomonas aeruginosa]MDY1253152.1 serine/threonine-protein kinase [Pseudomonas aeruginosa]
MTIPQEIDKYQLIRSLGAGHFGQVYYAFDRALASYKAIKVLNIADPNRLLESLKEAQVLALCRHKHIVAINEANIFSVNGQQRVVLDFEYMPNGSLEGAIQSRWLSLRESIDHLRGALTGLEFAHSQGILHRDIKPGNILLAAGGARLSDFGLATQVGAGSVGSGNGYIPHLPPEYFVNRQTSVLTDIYAAGMTLYRTVTNIVDWQGLLSSMNNFEDVVRSGSLIQRVGFDGYVPNSIRRIIRKACAPDAVSRYQSAEEFRQALDRLRFNVDWVRVADCEWYGQSGSDQYHLSVDASCKFVNFKRNNRRMTDRCRAVRNIEEAMSVMFDCIAETSLI